MNRFINKYRKILGLISAIMAVVPLVTSILVFKNLEAAKNMGYISYFFANYFGYGLYLLPFLVKVLNPVLLIVIGAFGVTIDEFFAWYAGKVSEELDRTKKFHNKIQTLVERHGLYAVFFLGLLPLPGIMYAISGFAAGHFKIPFYKFFLVNFSGKLIRTMVIIVGLIKIL